MWPPSGRGSCESRMARLTRGDLEICGLSDIRRFEIELHALFPDAAGALPGPMPPWLGPEALSGGMVRLAIRSWLLRLGGRIILVDTCVGEDKERPLRPDWHRRRATGFLAALAAEGLRPEDVDLVLCTHLHADHVGWNTLLENGRWVPTFPNARYLAGRQEYDAWRDAAAAAPPERPANHGAFADSVLPVMEAGRMDLVEDGAGIAPGLTLRASPGHTAGHMCLHAAHGAGGTVFSGDVIHSPLQLARPEWSSAFCADPAQARLTRRALLTGLADTGGVLVPTHFPDPGWCRIAADGDAFRPLPAD